MCEIEFSALGPYKVRTSGSHSLKLLQRTHTHARIFHEYRMFQRCVCALIVLLWQCVCDMSVFVGILAYLSGTSRS